MKLVSLGLLLVLVVVSSCVSGNIAGRATASGDHQSSANVEFVPCPAVFKNEACMRGGAVQIQFQPLFPLWQVPDNSLVESRMTLGKPECIYQKEGNTNLYRLQGRVLRGSNCLASDNGFICER